MSIDWRVITYKILYRYFTVLIYRKRVFVGIRGERVENVIFYLFFFSYDELHVCRWLIADVVYFKGRRCLGMITVFQGSQNMSKFVLGCEKWAKWNCEILHYWFLHKKSIIVVKSYLVVFNCDKWLESNGWKWIPESLKLKYAMSLTPSVVIDIRHFEGLELGP